MTAECTSTNHQGPRNETDGVFWTCPNCQRSICTDCEGGTSSELCDECWSKPSDPFLNLKKQIEVAKRLKALEGKTDLSDEDATVLLENAALLADLVLEFKELAGKLDLSHLIK